MDFAYNLEQELFRKEVHDFLQDELRQGTFRRKECAHLEGYSPEFSQKLAKKGWIGLNWPKEWGGAGRSHVDGLVLQEELLKAGAPTLAHENAEQLVGPALIDCGSPELKQEFLPRILQGTVCICLGYSEPNAGSDLASLETRAVEDSDGFTINGQKIWTSIAQVADYCWLLARTDPQVPKHKGLSVFLVDMKLPGVKVHGLTDITGGTHFAEVFFDNVYVPRKMLVGQKNQGWYQIAVNLEFQRGGMDRLMSNYPLLVDLIDYARKTAIDGRPLIEEPWVRSTLASLAVEFRAGRLLCYRVALALDRGESPTRESAASKAFCGEFEQRVADAATRIVGLHGQLLPDSPGAHLQGRAARNNLLSIAYTIGGGSSEILRNVIATRGLGLPRE